MNIVNVKTASKAYSVFLGNGALDQLPIFLASHFHFIRKLIIITDENVAKLHLDSVTSLLPSYQIKVYRTPIGEQAKTFEIYYHALTFMLEEKFGRDTILLAFGGGAIGDVGGFIASTYLRGIPFIQIPTTILAHDSAVGGKVAINHPIGKNMIGTIYQPEAVIYDLAFFDTLPTHERRSGFAEVIKHALIADHQFYQWLLKNIQSLHTIAAEHLLSMLTKGIKIKGTIVEQDEKEHGIRAHLNFGHTLAHAIEAEMGYGEITHGEAVVIGMVFALELSQEIVGLSFDMNLFREWLNQLGYSLHLPKDLSITGLINRMKQDKKVVNGEIRMVLLSEIGHPVVQTVSVPFLMKELVKYKGWQNAND